jgi:hypothetical protein
MLTIPHSPSSRPPGIGGRRFLSRFHDHLLRDEASLSRRLRTPSFPPTHASVEPALRPPKGHWWQNTRLCPLFVKVITATHATSCRTPTPGSAAPPQNHHLPGQDQMNNQRLFRHKMPQRWRRLQPLMPGGAFPHRRTYPAVEGVFCPLQRVRSQDPLLGGFAHACTEPAEVAVTHTTICRTNGRYPQHLSHQRNRLTSTTI